MDLDILDFGYPTKTVSQLEILREGFSHFGGILKDMK